MGAYKDKNGTWYAQFRFTNWKGEPDRKTKRGFATKREALDWERDFLPLHHRRVPSITGRTRTHQYRRRPLRPYQAGVLLPPVSWSGHRSSG